MSQTAAETLARALEQMAQGATRTRPVSMSLPGPLADALHQLSQSGDITSTSAATTEALTQWAYNRLLRLTLDELYKRDPKLRPSPARVRDMAKRLGVPLPPADPRLA